LCHLVALQQVRRNKHKYLLKQNVTSSAKYRLALLPESYVLAAISIRKDTGSNTWPVGLYSLHLFPKRNSDTAFTTVSYCPHHMIINALFICLMTLSQLHQNTVSRRRMSVQLGPRRKSRLWHVTPVFVWRSWRQIRDAPGCLTSRSRYKISTFRIRSWIATYLTANFDRFIIFILHYWKLQDSWI
jgi:hypothetical protein